MTIEEFIKIAKANGYDTDCPHWINKRDKAIPSHIRYALWKLFSSAFMGDQLEEMHCICGHDNCVNPLHYQFKPKLAVQLRLRVLKDEVEELLKEFDLTTFQLMGFWNYLEAFNEDNPLPARIIDMFCAANKVMTRNKIPPLPLEFLKTGRAQLEFRKEIKKRREMGLDVSSEMEMAYVPKSQATEEYVINESDWQESAKPLI
jgi:hypothetical protein